MKRLAAIVSVAGLGLMSAPGIVFCGSATVGLETRIALFLSGALLFVCGGSAYATMTSDAVEPVAVRARR